VWVQTLPRPYGLFCGQPNLTNNQAEWLGMQHALGEAEKVMTNPNVHVNIYSDSQLIVRQLSGRYQCHKEHLIPLYEASRAIYNRLDASRITVTFVKRHLNTIADGLATMGVRTQSGCIYRVTTDSIVGEKRSRGDVSLSSRLTAETDDSDSL